MFLKSKLLRFDTNRKTTNGDRIMSVSKYYRLTTEAELIFAETVKDRVVNTINKAINDTLTERQEKLIFCALVMGKSQGLKTKDLEPICGLNQTVYAEQMSALRVLAHSGIDKLNLAGKQNARDFFLDVINMTAVEFVTQAKTVAEPRKYPHEVVAKPTKEDVDNLTGKTFVAQLEELISIASPSDKAYARQRLSVL